MNLAILIRGRPWTMPRCVRPWAERILSTWSVSWKRTTPSLLRYSTYGSGTCDYGPWWHKGHRQAGFLAACSRAHKIINAVVWNKQKTTGVPLLRYLGIKYTFLCGMIEKLLGYQFNDVAPPYLRVKVSVVPTDSRTLIDISCSFKKRWKSRHLRAQQCLDTF